MFLDFRMAKKLAAQHDTPLNVISESTIRHNYAAMKKYLPRADVYFAMKVQGHKGILNILRNVGSNFDVASYAEAQSLLSIGVDATKMLFTNPVKTIPEIVRAYNVGVETFVFDNDSEIQKLARYAPGADVMVRVYTDNDNAIYKQSAKFGCPPNQANRILNKAKKLGLNPVGVAFNAGSHTLNSDDYLAAIKLCKKIFKEAAKDGIKLTELDIGGGYPPLTDPKTNSIKILKEVNEALEKHFPASGGVHVIAEPGRFLVKNAGTLITRVVGKSKRNGVIWYYLDDGSASSLMDLHFSGWKWEFLSPRKGKKILSVLAGPTCDVYDIISKEEWLPELEIGDLILVPDTGAYTNVLASRYNGFEPAKLVYIP